jgi:hypothetical protein
MLLTFSVVSVSLRGDQIKESFYKILLVGLCSPTISKNSDVTLPFFPITAPLFTMRTVSICT